MPFIHTRYYCNHCNHSNKKGLRYLAVRRSFLCSVPNKIVVGWPSTLLLAQTWSVWPRVQLFPLLKHWWKVNAHVVGLRRFYYRLYKESFIHWMYCTKPNTSGWLTRPVAKKITGGGAQRFSDGVTCQTPLFSPLLSMCSFPVLVLAVWYV
jgi:hypothetical protein